MKNFKIAIIISAILALVVFALPSVDSNDVTLTILKITEQQEVYGNGNYTNTSYTYLVSTDRGVYCIEPYGMFATPCFGTLKEGHTYKCRIQGVSMPTLGMFPYIIDAKEINEKCSQYQITDCSIFRFAQKSQKSHKADFLVFPPKIF